MLVINLRSDEYVTINGNITVKVNRVAGERIHLAIDAPREVPVVRGRVLDQAGERPACLDKAR